MAVATAVPIRTGASRRAARKNQRYSTLPITAPTRGKKQRAYFLDFSSHSKEGIGMWEYIWNAMAKLFSMAVLLLF